MIKRILILTVMISMLMTLFTVAAEDEETAISKYPKETAFLQALGIINKDMMSEFAPETKATRAAAAFMITRMLYKEIMNLPNLGTGFRDVGSDYWAAGEIYMGKVNGFINGITKDNYEPEAEITLAQVIKIIVNALGYEEIAQNQGGYPTGYLVVASSLGLLDKTPHNDTMTYDQLTVLIYRALNAPVFKKTSFGEQLKYTTNKNVTVLSEYHGIYKNEGIVCDNGITALSGHTRINKSEISIQLSGGDVYTYYKNEMVSDELLGMKVEYFFHDTKDTQDDLFFISPKGNQEISVLAENITDYTVKGYTYTDESGIEKNLRLAATPDIIYNNTAYMPATKSEMIPHDGKIRLIDRNQDDVYDVVFIYNIITICVDRKFEGEDFYNLRDVYGNSVSFEPDKIRMRILQDGKEVAFDSIDKWQIASVAISKDTSPDTLVTIYVSDNYIDGILSEMSNDGFWVINGKSYPLAYNLTSNIEAYKVAKDTVKYETVGTFRLDIEGRIAGVEEDILNVDDYVFMIASDYNKSSIQKEVTFKVLNAAGEFELLKANSYVVFNGTRKNVEEYMNILLKGAETIPPQMALISKTKDGKIHAIDLPQSIGSDSKLIADYVDLTATYKKTNRIFSGYFSVNDSSTIFFVRNDDVEDDEKYLALRPDDISDTGYSASVYNMEKNGIAKAVVLKGDTGTQIIGNDDLMCVVSKVVKTVDKDDITRTKVYFYQKGVKNSLLIAKSYDAKLTESERLVPGDAFRYFLDPASKEITTINKHLSFLGRETQLAEATASGVLQTDYNYLLRFVRGRVIDKTGTTIKVRIPRASEANGYIDLFFSMHRSNIMVYSVSKGTIRAGSIKDIRDLETVGNINSASMVLMRQRYGEVMDTIIYNP